MIKGTTLRPADRARRIEQLFPLLDHENDEYLRSFKLEVSKDMEVVPARVLPAPPIEFRGKYEEPFQGSWKVMYCRFWPGSVVCRRKLTSFFFANDSWASCTEAQHFLRTASSFLIVNRKFFPPNTWQTTRPVGNILDLTTHYRNLAEAQVRNFVRVLTQTLVEKGNASAVAND